ncbi:MAG: GNAT family N-acetyltransferase [Holosporaceae bacterium]|jgi:hypothetical protein|nr:GNAT family N-acetyltransferase [Holosporaceae bacterium]
MNIVKYEAKSKNIWNDFVKNSKNGTFLLDRNYMDYHSDYFVDHSLMFYDEEKLLAIMPASMHGDELISHEGLTYGGVICSRRMTMLEMLSVFSSLKGYMGGNGISKLIYKRIPSIYYTYPSDEDLYALFVNEAKLIRRDASTTISLANRIPFAKGKKWGMNKAKQANVSVCEFHDFDTFFECENKILMQKYKTNAVHTADEMRMLASRFPNNIKMLGGFLDNEFLAGTIIFKTDMVVHTQYIATTELGRELSAMDLVVDSIISSCYNSNIKYLDFGISTEQNGRYLNQGLVRQKEMFGGRAVVYDSYEFK